MWQKQKQAFLLLQNEETNFSVLVRAAKDCQLPAGSWWKEHGKKWKTEFNIRNVTFLYSAKILFRPGGEMDSFSDK